MALLAIFQEKNGYFYKILSGHPAWELKKKFFPK